MTAATPATTQLVLKPTFPLDEAEIGRRALSKKVRHPITVITLIACLAGGIVMQSGFWPVILLTTAGSLGVAWFWKRRTGKIEAEVIEEMVAESNRDQDKKLSRIISSYRSRGLHHYATALGKFLLLKQHIEERLHAERNGNPITPTVERVENLVDHLCGTVCREVHAVATLDGELADVLTSRNSSRLHDLQGTRTELLEAIMQAYETLHESLVAILELETAREAVAPDLEAKSQPPLEATRLDDVVEELREEARLAQRVRDRLQLEEAEAGDPDFGMFEDGTNEVAEVGELRMESE
ncbi:MAG: hypothetical protein AAGC68_06655 [Verrucomicrobiota bacterium]